MEKKYLSRSISSALDHKTGRAVEFFCSGFSEYTHIHMHALKSGKIGGQRSERGQAQHLVGNLFYEIKRVSANSLSSFFHFTFTTCGPPLKGSTLFFFILSLFIYYIWVYVYIFHKRYITFLSIYQHFNITPCKSR